MLLETEWLCLPPNIQKNGEEHEIPWEFTRTPQKSWGPPKTFYNALLKTPGRIREIFDGIVLAFWIIIILFIFAMLIIITVWQIWREEKWSRKERHWQRDR